MIGGVGEQVGDAAEVGLLADRQLERGDAGAERVPQLVERALEAARSRSSLLTKTMRGRPSSAAMPPHDLGLHLDALDRADHEDRQVGDPQRGVDVAHEVGVARACRSG